MVTVYILKLEGGKFYVGKTNGTIKHRLNAHMKSNGSAWTRMFKPVRVISEIPNCDSYDEDKYTIKYMKIYGIDNVRGGSFCEPELSQHNINTIKQMIDGTSDKCYRCGREGHFVSSCYATKHIDGHYISESESESESESDELSCYRCGRTGHFANRCYARRHVDGMILN